ncbi:hypothetical protein B296_00039392 [Ensete ventricosum]|uniref:Uncharacterized protein n=1 Tax=Ensete ventricosum TaxID=4639 RepID=A0A426ZTE6_ENSVE|nr:hypothetical protein B296_00039392 [Ensete ventricosum]
MEKGKSAANEITSSLKDLHLEPRPKSTPVVSLFDSFGESRLVLVAIARRRQLLNDDVLISLAEVSWKILDLSGSDVTDFGLKQVAEICIDLRAIDIRFGAKTDGCAFFIPYACCFTTFSSYIFSCELSIYTF